MKALRIAAAMLSFALAAVTAPTQAATAQSTFDVTVNLAAKCYVNITAAPADAATTNVSLTYSAFQTGVARGSTGFTVTCSNNLAYGIGVSDQTYTLAGIKYRMKLAAGTVAAYTTTEAAAEAQLAGQTGSGLAQDFRIGIEAPANQAGDCATASCTPSYTHTILVTY